MSGWAYAKLSCWGRVKKLPLFCSDRKAALFPLPAIDALYFSILESGWNMLPLARGAPWLWSPPNMVCAEGIALAPPVLQTGAIC